MEACPWSAKPGSSACAKIRAGAPGAGLRPASPPELPVCRELLLTAAVVFAQGTTISSMAREEKGALRLECRMDFGPENPKVDARTDGMPARDTNGMECKNGIMKLRLERDHPRLQQGSQQLSKGFGANYDFQAISTPRL